MRKREEIERRHNKNKKQTLRDGRRKREGRDRKREKHKKRGERERERNRERERGRPQNRSDTGHSAVLHSLSGTDRQLCKRHGVFFPLPASPSSQSPPPPPTHTPFFHPLCQVHGACGCLYQEKSVMEFFLLLIWIIKKKSGQVSACMNCIPFPRMKSFLRKTVMCTGRKRDSLCDANLRNPFSDGGCGH